MRLPFALAVTLASCHPTAARASAPPAATPVAAGLPHARIAVRSKAGTTPLDVEVASDDPSRERGLMFRRAVAPGTGMLFVFAHRQPHVFWMKNTLVPLDLLFLDDEGRIVGLLENAEPLTTTPRDPGTPSRYVLEVAGGTAFSQGWRPGDRVALPPLPPSRP